MVYSPADIKRVSLDYCVNLLSAKEPKSGYEHVFSNNEFLHNLRMNEKIDGNVDELPEEIFSQR